MFHSRIERVEIRNGKEIVHTWRRSFSIPPPNGEALEDTAARTLPFFRRAIMGDIRMGHDVLVFAHGNSNRSIVMELDELAEDEVPGLELATGVPVVYDIATDGTVSTFSHPLNLTPPSDVSGTYEWSPNLADWYSSGNGPGGNPIVTMVPNTVGTTTTVTATASQVLARIFLRVRVNQN